MMTLSRTVVAACASVLLLVGVAGAASGPLAGTVGPGFTIVLADSTASPVAHLDPGTFSLTIDDLSDEHNFHLQGPGVDVATSVADLEKKTFSITLRDGKYTFICDVHPTRMAGTFTAGTPPPDPLPTPKPVPPPAKPPLRLVLTVTAKTVLLTTLSGKRVRAMRAQKAVVTVRDRTKTRGVTLIGRRLKRSTGLRFVGTVKWTVKLSTGKLVYSSTGPKPRPRGGSLKIS